MRVQFGAQVRRSTSYPDGASAFVDARPLRWPRLQLFTVNDVSCSAALFPVPTALV